MFALCSSEMSYLLNIVIIILTISHFTPKSNNTRRKRKAESLSFPMVPISGGAQTDSSVTKYSSAHRGWSVTYLTFLLLFFVNGFCILSPAHSYQALRRLYDRSNLSLSKLLSHPCQAQMKLLQTTPSPLSHPSPVSSHLYMPHARVMAKIGRLREQRQSRDSHHSESNSAALAAHFLRDGEGELDKSTGQEGQMIRGGNCWPTAIFRFLVLKMEFW